MAANLAQASIVAMQARLVDNLVERDTSNKNHQQLTNIDQLARALFLGHKLAVVDSKSHENSAQTINKAQQLIHAFDHIVEDLVQQLASHEDVTSQEDVSTPEMVVITNDEGALAQHICQVKYRDYSVVTDLNQALDVAAEYLNQAKQVLIVAVTGVAAAKLEAKTLEGKTLEDKALDDKTLSEKSSPNSAETVSGVMGIALANAEDNHLHSYGLLSFGQSCSLPFTSSCTQGITQNDSQLAQVAQANDNAQRLSNHIETMHQALSIEPKQVHVVEQSQMLNANTKVNVENFAEISALSHVFSPSTVSAKKTDKETRTTAAANINSMICGDSGFSQLLALVRSVLCLNQNYIPSVGQWQLPIESQPLWQQSAFYVAQSSRPWFYDKQHLNTKRYAAYSCLSNVSGVSPLRSYRYILISDSEQTKANLSPKSATDNKLNLSNGFLAHSEYKLFVFAGTQCEHLLNQLAQCRQLLSTEKTSPCQLLAKISQDLYQHLQVEESTQHTPLFRVTLLASSIDELDKEIALAIAGVTAAFDTEVKSNEWKTPRGSYFSAMPATHSNSDETSPGITFLYPGIGATYIGLGQALFQLFPQVLPAMNQITPHLSHSLKDLWLNPRSVEALSFEQLQDLDKSLRASLPDIAEAGVAYACLFTQIFQRVFKLNADFAAGYSMGEVSMFAALGCWQDPSAMSERLAHSDTFNHQICGELLALNRAWGLSEQEIAATSDDSFKKWQTYTIKAKLADIEPLLVDEPKVYCTIVNTANNLVIAGEPQACQRIFEKLKVRAMPLYMANAIHSPPAHSEYQAMIELYSLAVAQKSSTKIYSSSCYLPVPQLSKAIAVSIAKCLCDRVDFPRLVDALYQDGARIFLELGPGRSLSSWVEKILADKTHTAVSINAKGSADELTILKALAKLISHGAQPDLSVLFTGSVLKDYPLSPTNRVAIEKHNEPSPVRSY